MATIETLFKITAAVAGANAVKELGEAVNKVSTNGEKMSRGFAQAGIALKAFAASEAVAMLKEMIGSSIELGDHLNDLSQKTGVSVETLGKFKVAAENSGTDIDSLGKAIAKLSKNQVEAQGGSAAQIAAFKAIGVSASELNSLKPDELVLRIADAFESHADGAKKAALAQALMGKSGAELIPFLNNGREEIEKFALSIDTQFAKSADLFNDKIGIIKAEIKNMSISAAKDLLPALNDIASAFVELFDTKTDFKDFFEYVGEGLKAIAALAIGLVTSLRSLISTIGTLVQAARILKDGVAATLSGEQFDILGKFQTLGEEYGRKQEEIWMKGFDSFDTLYGLNGKGGEANQLASTKPAPKPQLPFSGAAGAGKTDSETKALESYITKLKEENTTLAQQRDLIGLTSIEADKLKEARKLDQAFAEKTVGMSPKLVEAYRKQAEAQKQARLEILQANYDAARTATSGAKEFFAKYAEDATNAAEQVKTVMGDAFKGIEDAFVKFTTTGKLSFKEMANSIIQDLARILVRQSITGPLAQSLGGLFGGGSGGLLSGIKSLFPFANGGVMTDTGPIMLKKYANGGIANRPQLAMFGEGSMPEAYVPLPDGRRIPVALSGGGGMQNNVSVTVNMTTGATSAQGDSNKANELGKVIAAAVKAQLIDEKRPGGLLAA